MNKLESACYLAEGDEAPFDKLHEECGVFGIYRADSANKSVVAETYHALYALQHRGQESCGIVVNDDGVMKAHKDNGLVTEVFTRDALSKIHEGTMAAGHCRYGTTGSQPFQCPAAADYPSKRRDGAGHNGNLTNARSCAVSWRTKAPSSTAPRIPRSSATSSPATACGWAALRPPSARRWMCWRAHISLVIMSATKLIAVPRPPGYRPLCIGTLPGGGYVFASESCALDAAGATLLRDVEPGEIVIADTKTGELRTYQGSPARPDTQMCVFEFIYFARPDCVIEGSSVHEARMQAGRFLAHDHPVQADVVIGVPDSGLDAAIGYSRTSGIPYGIGFIKNKYIGRTFIQPGQKQRQDAVRIKLNAISATVKGKRVVMVDDSIVRGTTCARIVHLLREAGATEVHVRLSAPPFTYPCFFGTDVDSKENLIAAHHSVEEIGKIIGADSIGFLSLEACDKLAADSHCGFCKGCFCGKYPVDPPLVTEKNKFDQPIHGGKVQDDD